MTFRSKIDKYFIISLFIYTFIIAVVSFFPFFIEDEYPIEAPIIMITIFISSVGFLAWCGFAVKYTFYEDYLLVKGGPFRSKISYKDITKVSPTTELLTGYRILSSKDAIELFYKTGTFGSVKISPKDKEKFIIELEKRCKNIKIDM